MRGFGLLLLAQLLIFIPIALRYHSLLGRQLNYLKSTSFDRKRVAPLQRSYLILRGQSVGVLGLSICYSKTPHLLMARLNVCSCFGLVHGLRRSKAVHLTKTPRGEHHLRFGESSATLTMLKLISIAVLYAIFGYAESC